MGSHGCGGCTRPSVLGGSAVGRNAVVRCRHELAMTSKVLWGRGWEEVERGGAGGLWCDDKHVAYW